MLQTIDTDNNMKKLMTALRKVIRDNEMRTQGKVTADKEHFMIHFAVKGCDFVLKVTPDGFLFGWDRAYSVPVKRSYDNLADLLYDLDKQLKFIAYLL